MGIKSGKVFVIILGMYHILCQNKLPSLCILLNYSSDSVYFVIKAQVCYLIFQRNIAYQYARGSIATSVLEAVVHTTCMAPFKVQQPKYFGKWCIVK